MKTGMLAALLAWTVFGSCAQAAGAATNDATLRLIVQLTDGSRLVGATPWTNVPLQTSYGVLRIPLERIRSLSRSESADTVILLLAQGDRLQGTLTTNCLPLRTCFGDVSVSVSNLAAVSVRTGSLDGDLVACWTFDDGSLKDTVQGLDALPRGDLTYAAGVRGKAPLFTSKDTYLLVKDPRLNLNQWRELTVSVWVNYRQYPTYGTVIARGMGDNKLGGFIVCGVGGNGAAFTVVTKESTEPFGAGSRSMPGNRQPASRPALNTWIHLAGTYDGERIRFYVNGRLDGETEDGHRHGEIRETADAELVIGTAPTYPYRDWSDQFHPGLIDEVRIWKRALTEDEIQSVYSDSSPAAEGAIR